MYPYPNVGPRDHQSCQHTRQGRLCAGQALRPSKALRVVNETLRREAVREGCAVAQAVSLRVRAWVRSCGICGEQSGTRAGFLRVLRIPLSVISPTAPHSSSCAGTIGQ
jgi:hypothetical protein